MSSDQISEQTVDQKIVKYEHFVNEVLRNDLKRVVERQEQIGRQLNDYLQIKSTINGIENKLLVDSCEQPLKMKTDIGSNFYVECVIPNPQTIYLLIGMGFFLQMSLKEALDFINKKEILLNEELNQLSVQSSAIKANIKLVIQSIAELNNL